MTRKHRKSSVRSSNNPRDNASRNEGPETGQDRLQKVLAAAGVASRRDCEELIREGRVEVDRKVVTELGTRVDPVAQEIRVDGEPLRRPKRVYFALNKPMDVVCTNHDPSGRTRVIDLVPDDERVFAVGRLDRASEGLILVTNDGNFANHITHPRYGVEKTYLVRVAGRPGHEELAKLRRGVHLAEGFCKVESVVVKSRHKQSSDLLIVLDEGRNREIRRILAKVGHKVVRLKRIAVGELKLGALATGEWRKLTQPEIDALLAISRKKRKDKKKPPPREAPPATSDESAEVTRDERPKKPAAKQSPGKQPPAKQATTPRPAGNKPKPPSAKDIAARVLSGGDFEDEDEDFEEEDFGGEALDEVLSDDEGEDDDDDDFGDAGFDDDDDLIEQTVIREEVRDDRRPPRSGPAPRGDVIDFDEDSPPPLQPRSVREPKSKREQPKREQKSKREQLPFAPDKPLRAEPRTGHRRRGSEQGRGGQSTRRGQRHRQEEERVGKRGGDDRRQRPDRPDARPDSRQQVRGEERADKPLPKRPGKLVPNRPQEDRGARGKYPGKSFGKGKKFEGGGRGPKTIFGKRVKKKNRGRP